MSEYAKASTFPAVTACPKGHTDIRGPYDTKAPRGEFLIIRVWMCRTCWWNREVTLIDDTAAQAALATRRPSDRGRR